MAEEFPLVAPTSLCFMYNTPICSGFLELKLRIEAARFASFRAFVGFGTQDPAPVGIRI